MVKRVDELPVVLTCFAYRDEYFPEMEGMLATIREHHPNWRVVVGRGPVAGFDLPTLEVESLEEKCTWTLPVSLDLDGSEHDWRKITRMKGWWMARVWREYGNPGDSVNRVLWLDADARLNGPLDIELDPEAEVVASPVEDYPQYPDYDGLCSGLLLFQGFRSGTVETILDLWSSVCLSQIQDLRPPTVPWLDGDQEVLNEVLQSLPDIRERVLLKLDHNKYVGYANNDGTTPPGALVDQWQMSKKMKFPECRERNWPPPEEARRRSAKGQPGR